MKASRKVGRRKHGRHSYITRRRLRNKKNKSGYRKKHAKTQKGGKRGRGHKRTRTYKRGKRFHMGGMDANCYVELGEPSVFFLKYKKQGLFSTNDTKPFMVSVFGCKSDNTCSRDFNNVSKIVLTRQGDGKVTITMEIFKHPDNLLKLEVLSKGVAYEDTKEVKYDFYYTENDSMYQYAMGLIKTHIETLKEKNTQLEKKENRIISKDITAKIEAAFQRLSQIGDDLEVTLKYETSEAPSFTKVRHETLVKFSDFKTDLEKLANETKEKIESLHLGEKIDQVEKDRRFNIVDETLHYELEKQLGIMKSTYIAQATDADAEESDFGKLTLIDQTSQRVRENLQNKNKIMEQADAPVNSETYQHQTNQSTIDSSNFAGYTKPPTLQYVPTPENTRWADHYGTTNDSTGSTGSRGDYWEGQQGQPV
jgi:hypothetical protein